MHKVLLLWIMSSCCRVCTSGWAFSCSLPLRVHRFQVAAILVEHYLVLVVLVLGRASLLIVDVRGCHQLLINISQVEFLCLTVVHQQKVIELRWLVTVERHLFIFALADKIDLVGGADCDCSSWVCGAAVPLPLGLTVVLARNSVWWRVAREVLVTVGFVRFWGLVAARVDRLLIVTVAVGCQVEYSSTGRLASAASLSATRAKSVGMAVLPLLFLAVLLSTWTRAASMSIPEPALCVANCLGWCHLAQDVIKLGKIEPVLLELALYAFSRLATYALILLVFKLLV